MENVCANQTFLVTNVTDVLMDSMDFQTVNVGFSSFFFVICLRYFRGNGNSLNLQGIRKKSQPHDFLTPNFFLLSYQIVWRIISSSSLLVDIFFKILLLNKNIKNNFVFALEIYKSHFSACSCNVKGSIGTNCDRNGKCTCKSNTFAGVKCENKIFKQSMYLTVFFFLIYLMLITNDLKMNILFI